MFVMKNAHKYSMSNKEKVNTKCIQDSPNTVKCLVLLIACNTKRHRTLLFFKALETVGNCQRPIFSPGVDFTKVVLTLGLVLGNAKR